MTIVVIGNAAVDEFMTVAAWPAPGTSVLARAGRRDLGGKGVNQALVLARCGLDVRLAACIGRDPAGDWILGVLAEEGMAADRCRRCDMPTDRSIVIIGPDGDNAIVTTVDCAGEMAAADVRQALDDAGPGDCLLLQGNLRIEITRTALEHARARGVATVFNPSPVREGFAALWPLVDLAVLNRHEAAELTGRRDPDTAALDIHGRGAGTAVVTLGAAGALACTAGGLIRAPAPAVEAGDTTGAGDTFTAVLVAAWRRRGALDRAGLAAAAAAAAITVTRPGTRSAFPSRDELRPLLAAAA